MTSVKKFFVCVKKKKRKPKHNKSENKKVIYVFVLRFTEISEILITFLN